MRVSSSKFKNKVKIQIPYLRRFAYALVNDREQADRLVVYCINSALAQQANYNANIPLKAWLYSIFHNLYVTHLNQAALHNPHAAEQAAAKASNHKSILMAALQNLPLEYKVVFILITLEDMTYQETASILDITVGSVISRLCIARRRLQIITDAPY